VIASGEYPYRVFWPAAYPEGGVNAPEGMVTFTQVEGQAAEDADELVVELVT